MIQHPKELYEQGSRVLEQGQIKADESTQGKQKIQNFHILLPTGTTYPLRRRLSFLFRAFRLDTIFLLFLLQF